MGMHPVTTESKCTLATCWTVRNASQVGVQTRSPVLRVAPNGRETGLSIRRRWRRTFQGHCQGGAGGGRCTAIRRTHSRGRRPAAAGKLRDD